MLNNALKNVSPELFVDSFDAMTKQITDASRRVALSTAAGQKIYSLTNPAVRDDVIGAIDPISSYSNRQRLHFATVALNYAKIPYSEQLAEAGVRLANGIATEKKVKQAINRTVAAAIPMDYINSVVYEIQSRMDAVRNLLADIGSAVQAGASDFVLENKVAQAKLDMRLLTGQLTIISDLIEKIAGSLSSSKEAGPTNIQTIISTVLQAIDLILQLIRYVEELTENMSPEEYDRLMALVAALDKTKATNNKPSFVEILRTIFVVALDMIQPYITHLMLMLAFECFNAIMKFIKKIPGAGGAFPPPIDMIPSAISLVVMVISGNLNALISRLNEDIEIIGNFLRASIIVGVASDAHLAAAEKLVANENVANESKIQSLKDQDDTTTSPTMHSFIIANNEKIEAVGENIVITAENVMTTTALNDNQKRNAITIKEKEKAEKIASKAAAVVTATAEAANESLISNTLLHKHEIGYGKQ